MERGSDFIELRIGGRREILPLLAPEVLIGRATECAIVLVDPSVSRVHAAIVRVGSTWLLRDLGSRNGCQVNGVRISSDRALHEGDEIRIGESVLLFRSRQLGPHLERTAPAGTAPELTRREREILLAFAQQPASGTVFRALPSVRQVATALHVSEAAVKQHLSHLYEKFSIGAGANRRAALLEEAVRLGAITLGDVGANA